MSSPFDYNEAFKRTLGWITPKEAEILRNKRVALAGVGGVGGNHVLTLARLGVGKLTIADPDQFELLNFNRQAGAMISTLGKDKVNVMAAMARDINPELDIKIIKAPITKANQEEFLEGADLYVDGVDFWAFDDRIDLFEKCRTKKIPAITAAPLGTGCAFLAFHPEKMSFDDYFRLKDVKDHQERAYRFLVGLAPRFLHRSYLVDPSYVDFKAEKGPSTPMACQLCAGIACTEALKILVGRGNVLWAPRGFQFDPYENKLVTTWRPGGFYNPLQQLTYYLLKNALKSK